MSDDYDICVGKISYYGSRKLIPSKDGYSRVEVMMKSSPYWELSPYYLHTDDGCILENVWQFSKVYETVPASKERYSRFDHTVIWQHPKQKHYDVEADKLTDEYLFWRNKGFYNPHAVRYPVGFRNRNKCLFSLSDTSEPLVKLDYVAARKAIYLPLYCDLVKKEAKFAKLKGMLEKGKKLLIVEVDGPHQESLEYYRENYGVSEDFIVDDIIQASEENMRIMLNDPKHAFGHGYCLAVALKEMELSD